MTDVTTKERAGTRRATWRRLPILVILAVAVVGYVGLRDRLGFPALAENREMLLALRDSNYLACVLCFLGVYVVIVAFSLPGATIVSLAGGFLFGTWPGVPLNMLAATAGATIVFTAARAGLGDRLAARMEASEGTMHRIKRGIDENQWSMLFLIRLVPVVPFFVANLAPALFGVPTWRFVVSTFLGIIPGAIVYTSVGAGLGEVFAAGAAPDLGIIFEPKVLLPILGLCLLALLPVLLKAFGRTAKV